MFWKERECECVTPASLLSPGAQGRGGGAVTRGADPVWSRAQQSVGTSPPPPARVDSPGDFHALPRLCPSQMLQAPRVGPTVPPRGATAVWYWRCGCCCYHYPPKTPAPNSSGNTGAKPLAGRRGVPHPHGRCRGSSRVAVAREEARPQQRRVWIPRIPPPDKEA